MSDPVWNNAFQGEPLSRSSLGAGDDAIRRAKRAVRNVVAREHAFDLSEPGKQGYLRKGSGKAFTESSAPQVRPDGTEFTSEDIGRMWYKHEYPNRGYYVLGGVTAGVPQWYPVVEGIIGEVRLFSGVFVNPTFLDGSWYTTGTSPGWVIADGTTYALPGGGTIEVPDLRGRFLRFDDTPLNESDKTTISLVPGQIPPHKHDVGELSGTTSENGEHDHRIRISSGGIGLGPIDSVIASSVDNVGGWDSRNNALVYKDGKHTHTVTIPAHSTQNFGDSDPITIPDPDSVTLIPIIRIY